jgi:ABC-type cobalamin/Fe3+-siderophores transport system ATPase subunit
MIIGMFLRHYKVYEGLHFIPLCVNTEKYSILIGNNGVGKSSILEALNTFFNDNNWNKHKVGKKDEALIAPLFLIKKDACIPIQAPFKYNILNRTIISSLISAIPR